MAISPSPNVTGPLASVTSLQILSTVRVGLGLFTLEPEQPERHSAHRNGHGGIVARDRGRELELQSPGLGRRQPGPGPGQRPDRSCAEHGPAYARARATIITNCLQLRNGCSARMSAGESARAGSVAGISDPCKQLSFSTCV